MHHEAMKWVARCITEQQLDTATVSVLDLGGRDVNGTTAQLWAKPVRYVVVDIYEHPSVNVVCDAADLDLAERFDVVTSTECLEHAERAPEIIKAACRHLNHDGVFIATMAGPGRAPHGQHGDTAPAEGEFYRNVEPEDLHLWLSDAGFERWRVDQLGTDLRCIAWR